MINLMPPEAKTGIGFARYNLRLMRWTVSSLLIVAAMAATVLIGGWYIDNAKSNLNRSIDETKQAIASQKLDQVKQQAETLSEGVKLIVQVLSKEVQFSKLLQQLGTLMPSGATLGAVQLSNKVNGALDLSANAIDYQTASQVQVNLQDSENNLFDKVDALNVTCNESASSTTVDGRYKCQILIRALFKKDAAVTFLAAPPVTNPATGVKP